MIKGLLKSGKWKIHLTVKINFISSKENNNKQCNRRLTRKATGFKSLRFNC